MSDDNLLSLLTSINSGLFGSGLTLFAIYPAVAMLVANQLSRERASLVEYNRQRKSMLTFFAIGIVSSWCGLLTALVLLVLGTGVSFLMALAIFFTGISLCFIGISAWQLFQTASNLM